MGRISMQKMKKGSHQSIWLLKKVNIDIYSSVEKNDEERMLGEKTIVICIFCW